MGKAYCVTCKHFIIAEPGDNILEKLERLNQKELYSTNFVWCKLSVEQKIYDTWLCRDNMEIVKRHPSEINKDNDCDTYEPKEFGAVEND